MGGRVAYTLVVMLKVVLWLQRLCRRCVCVSRLRRGMRVRLQGMLCLIGVVSNTEGPSPCVFVGGVLGGCALISRIGVMLGAARAVVLVR